MLLLDKLDLTKQPLLLRYYLTKLVLKFLPLFFQTFPPGGIQGGKVARAGRANALNILLGILGNTARLVKAGTVLIGTHGNRYIGKGIKFITTATRRLEGWIVRHWREQWFSGRKTLEGRGSVTSLNGYVPGI